MDIIEDNSDTISINSAHLAALVENDIEITNREIKELRLLGKHVSSLHTEILYNRKPNSKIGSACLEAWKALVKIIGGSGLTRCIGSAVGINNSDLEYIMNSTDIPADTMLKVFALNDNATLDKIVNVFIEYERYDLLSAIERPLKDLARWFNTDDSGYISGTKNTDDSNTKKIIRCKYNALSIGIPPVLLKHHSENKDPNQPESSLRPPKTSESQSTNESPILFLTFAKDGVATATNIKCYIQNWDNNPKVNVVTLNDRREEVYPSPENFIRECFEKADYVVPIITLEYLKEIKSHNPNTAPSTSDHLDCKYVNFIYNLMITHYIHASGCYNKKVRSVLPLNSSVDVLRSINMYPDLMPWTYESNFDEQFKAFMNVLP